MRRIALASLLLLAGCVADGDAGLRFEPSAAYHPPLPEPVEPPRFSRPDPIVVLTPDVAADLDREIRAGRLTPYAFFALSPDDYLALAQWQTELEARLEAWRAVACFYRAERNEPACAAGEDAPANAAEDAP